MPIEYLLPLANTGLLILNVVYTARMVERKNWRWAIYHAFASFGLIGILT